MSQLECRAAPWGGQAGASPGPTSHIGTLPLLARLPVPVPHTASERAVGWRREKSCNSSCRGVRRKHADGRRYVSTGHAYESRMITPLLRCAPLATFRGRCHGREKSELTKRGARAGSPSSFWGHNILTQPRPPTFTAHRWRAQRCRRDSAALVFVARKKPRTLNRRSLRRRSGCRAQFLTDHAPQCFLERGLLPALDIGA